MKSILLATVVLLASTVAGAAHTGRNEIHLAPLSIPAVPAVSDWRYGLQNFKTNERDSGDGQTLTGGPSGGPNQS